MKRLLAVLMVLVAVSACRRPAMEETFVRVADRDALGRYGFQVDLADSTLTYDLDLLVGMACDDVVFSSFRQLPLRLQWTAPSGQPYEETVWMRRKELSDSTFYEKHFWVEYRHVLRPVQAGVWDLAISIPENLSDQFNVTGTGLRLTRHGTR